MQTPMRQQGTMESRRFAVSSNFTAMGTIRRSHDRKEILSKVLLQTPVPSQKVRPAALKNRKPSVSIVDHRGGGLLTL